MIVWQLSIEFKCRCIAVCDDDDDDEEEKNRTLGRVVNGGNERLRS
jgi:hypothetical protein